MAKISAHFKRGTQERVSYSKREKGENGWINGRVQSVVMFMTRLKEIQITVWHQEQPGKMFHMIGYVLFAGLQKLILL